MKFGIIFLSLITVLLNNGCGILKEAESMKETLAGFVVDVNGNVVSEDDLLETDYLLLYFSAHWCPPCKVFTPKLVEFYNKNEGGKLFQTLFISSDHNETDMFNYMRTTYMPWSAIQYGSDAAKTLTKTFGEKGIPRLVLINPKGEIIADSFKGSQYLGPQVVLEQLKIQLAKLNSQFTETNETNDSTKQEANTDEYLPTPKNLKKNFKINGFGQGSSKAIAIINGKFTAVGAELDKGIVVENITSTYVEISFEGAHYRLYP